MTSNKSNWPTVKFEKIAQNVSKRVDPTKVDTDIYVGLEHLDPSTIHLREWGHPSDVKGQKLAFKKGDVIFGRRRAYQRKLAVAEFDGICSAHAMVLRAKPEMILPEFLPFFLQSDMFMERAIEISVGSLSPTINWKTMRIQEFPLPPIDEQKRIAEILWAADEAVEKWTQCKEDLNKLIETTISNTAKDTEVKNWEMKPLSEIANVSRGKFSHRPRNLSHFYGGPYPFAQTGDVQRAYGFIEEFDYTLTEEGKKYSKSFPSGTILITIAAVIGATAITKFETWATDSVVGIIPNKELNVYFLEYFLRTKRHYLENIAATQTAQKNINLKTLNPLKVPVPPLEVQTGIIEQISEIQSRVEEVEKQIQKSRGIIKAFTN
ncbi:restriction endonuclease subunit S [Maridesulfovibrio sp.]|uniref:restriction endonuclease subunit S n=1 Tax=Maridesulfovibrio sp. TaxID=2795000 RepID=UPI0029CA7162|nr:restriction endonuclease subunit S [Maridesulfovibrio sp.]